MAVNPVDRLLGVYNALMAAVWLALSGRAPFAPVIAVAHAAAAALPWLLAQDAAQRTARPVRLLVAVYPLLWLGAYWTEMDFLRHWLHGRSFDHLIAPLDRFAFGVHLQDVWIHAWDAQWWSELMHGSYFAYYLVIVAPPLALLASGRHHALRDVVFRLMVTYVACYVVYLVLPIDGPGHTMARYAGPLTDGSAYRMVRAAMGFGDALGTAFPSSHAAGAVTIAVVMWRWFPRWAAILATLEAVGVALSTVYTQNHFAIDSVAGVAYALALQAWAVPALRRVFGARRRRPIPVLVPARWPGGQPGGERAS